jgi:hypothetical protein
MPFAHARHAVLMRRGTERRLTRPRLQRKHVSSCVWCGPRAGASERGLAAASPSTNRNDQQPCFSLSASRRAARAGELVLDFGGASTQS